MELIYLGNKNSKPICRDAEDLYAKSLGIPFMDLEEALSKRLYESEDLLCITDAGWKTDEYINLLESWINNLKKLEKTCYLRIVDCNNGRFDYLDCKLYHLIMTYDKIKIIAPYKIKYFNQFDPIFIPYHFESVTDGPHTEGIILSGFNDPIYPLRKQLYDSPYKPDQLEILQHPGYSGRMWKTSKLGNDFIRYLSLYKVMIVTTSQDFELLKYVECAEAGCCPIGEFPSSLSEVMPDSLSYLRCTTANEVYNKSITLIKNGEWRYYAEIYRNFMQEIRSKDLILKSYKELR